MSPEEKEAYIASKIEDDMEKSNLKHAKEEGKAERDIEIAKAMLLDGDSAQKITRITGLSIIEIEKLKS